MSDLRENYENTLTKNQARDGGAAGCLPVSNDFYKSWVICSFVYGFLMVGLLTSTIATSSIDNTVMFRNPASLAFPKTREVSDVEDVLKVYAPYLRFVEVVGKKTDAESTVRLVRIFDALRKRDPRGAARFLKGLRFEMTQKLEFMGVATAAITSDTPEIRQWVGRFVKVWQREADELLFRAIAMK